MNDIEHIHKVIINPHTVFSEHSHYSKQKLGLHDALSQPPLSIPFYVFEFAYFNYFI